MLIYSGAPVKSVLLFLDLVSFFDRNNCPFISGMGVRNEPVYAVKGTYELIDIMISIFIIVSNKLDVFTIRILGVNHE